MLVQELGPDWEQRFDIFDTRPTASASIGQVHRASVGGVPVAVKVQYPAVRDSIVNAHRRTRPRALRVLLLSEKRSAMKKIASARKTMPEVALFANGTMIMLIVVAGCLKLGRAEEAEARRRANINVC